MYLLSKIAFTVFASITGIILASFYIGDPLGLVGILSLFGSLHVVFGVNTTLLVISTIFYIWQRAHRDNPAHQKSVVLEAYAQGRPREEEAVVQRFVVDEDLSAFSETHEMVSIALTEELSGVHNGDTIQLLSPLSTEALTVKVLSKQDSKIQLRVIH